MDEVRHGKKVYVGLSGGVDSSLSAYLLKKQGYDVTGVFIKVWQPDFVDCTWRDDRLDAMRVCAHLGIPFRTLDLEDEYKKSVIDYMLSEYKRGRTPNPDVMCNREIKFGAFLEWAKEQGGDFIATGHYARNVFNKKTGLYELRRSLDESKDQTYFLWTLTQEVLAHVLFPVGCMRKAEVRKIAEEVGIPTAQKKDSQGLCFISNVDMKDFLKHFIDPKPGKVLDENGKVVGRHDGAVFATLGERHGFLVETSHRDEKPYYVVGKNVMENTLMVSHTSPALGEPKEILLEGVQCISGALPSPGPYRAQTRYHGPEVAVHVALRGDRLTVTPRETLLSPPGQSLVLYDGNVCIGGGVIV